MRPYLCAHSCHSEQVLDIASSGPAHLSLLSSCSLSDDYAHIIGRAAICLLADDAGTLVRHGNSPLSAKLFDIFGGMSQSVAPVPLGCDADCEDDHDDDGNCLSCGRDWDHHAGHQCVAGTRYDRIVSQ